MAFIVFSQSLLDGRIQLGAEEITRPLAFGTNWNRIRIGIRWAFLTQGSIGLWSDFLLGVCQGPKGFTSLNPLDVITTHPGYTGLGVAQWSYSAGVLNNSNTAFNAYKKIGPTISQIATSAQPTNVYAPAFPLVNSVRSAYYIDITKYAGGVGFNMWAPATIATASSDLNRYLHLANMENDGTPSCPAGAFSLCYISNTPIVSNQLWDTVQLSWSRSMPVIEINDITVIRFY